MEIRCQISSVTFWGVGLWGGGSSWLKNFKFRGHFSTKPVRTICICKFLRVQEISLPNQPSRLKLSVWTDSRVSYMTNPIDWCVCNIESIIWFIYGLECCCMHLLQNYIKILTLKVFEGLHCSCFENHNKFIIALQWPSTLKASWSISVGHSYIWVSNRGFVYSI